jgi:N-acetylmuramoyl-L-alanine amidase
MPSVLIELGFLSNGSEEKFLNSKDGQTYLSSAIFRAIKAYKEEIEAM